MQIKWFGHASFRIAAADGYAVITDPYEPECVGYAPIVDSADVVVISSDDDEGHCRADLIPGKPLTINALTVAREGGQTDVARLSIRAIEAAEWELHPDHAVPGANGMYRFELDGITIAHMGDVGNSLTDSQIDFFAGVDVLLALAGGPPTIALPDLMKLITIAKPKLVIPMHFRTLTYRPRNSLWIESFLAYFDDKQVDFACATQIEVTTDTLTSATRVTVMDYAR